MKAAFIDAVGPAAGIRFDELPVPEPQDDEVLVRVRATAVNAVDAFVRSGAYPTPMTFPFVIGRDAVGEVVADAAGFAAGERVWTNSLGYGGRQGAAAEFAAVPAERLYRMPDGVDPVAMVAIVHAAATAHLALHTHGEVAAGQTVLIAGGAGNVGRAAVRIARDAGARVIATAGAGAEVDADIVLDYRDPDLAERLRRAAPDGVDVHLDTSGHHDLELATSLLAPRGRIVLMAGLREHPALPVGALYTKDASIRGFAISSARVSELADAARLINRMAGAGALVPGAVEVLPLAAAADAHARLETGGAHGVKLVLVPGGRP